jgi:hypothetical protein
MKTPLKNALLAAVIAASVIACKGKGETDTDTLKTDSSTITTVTDTLKKDTSSLTPDSLKQDTAITTTKTETKTKKTEINH